MVEARPRLEVVGVEVDQDVQHPTKLGQPLAARRVDGGERAPRGLDVGGEDPVGCLRLQHDHRKAVRDQVVQLPRDPGSLMVDGGPGGFLAVAFERLGPRRQPAHLRAPMLHPATQPPGPAEDEPCRQDLIDRIAGLEAGDVDAQHQAASTNSPTAEPHAEP